MHYLIVLQGKEFQGLFEKTLIFLNSWQMILELLSALFVIIMIGYYHQLFRIIINSLLTFISYQSYV